MQVLTPQEMQAAENQVFARGVARETLMREAADGLARVVRQFFPRPGTCVAYVGKGHNGGDALLALRLLTEAGWATSCILAYPEEHMASATRVSLAAWQNAAQPAVPPRGPLVLLDGLLGLGSALEPREPLASLVGEMNRRRREEGARIVAVDLPTGLDPLTGRPFQHCVQADITVTFGAAKRGLLSDEATNHVGRIAGVLLPEIEANKTTDRLLITPELVRSWIPPREFDSYKGTYGHLGIIAGSPGYFGAAKLTALGALHSGAGLVTLLTRPQHFPYLSTTCPPEIMVKIVDDFNEVLALNFDAIVVGPGLVNQPAEELVEIFRLSPVPMLLDAGALDILGNNLKLLRLVSAPRVLTPHPGEMQRIYPHQALSRADLSRQFVDENPCVLLYKGARTIITAPGRPLYFNTTGNPGMGTGGMGDVLSGVIGGLLAQGIRPTNAAGAGAWLCGRAAEAALSGGESEQSLSAAMIPAHLGRAFQSLSTGDR